MSARSGAARNRYFDVIRALAVLWVVGYHAFGYSSELTAGVLGFIPAMGVLFALGGSLMAASLGRSDSPLTVIGNRLRRLLPALWVLGIVVVPAMLIHGWTASGEGAGRPLHWPELLLWFVPVVDPPSSDWGGQVTAVLWFLRAYLWFVVLSPLLLLAFRRAPVAVAAVPLAIVAAQALGVVSLDGLVGSAMLDFGIYGACWMLGFAHHDGSIQRARMPVLVGLAALALAAAAGWAFTHPVAWGDSPYDLNEIPLGNALWSIGVVLVLLRFSPSLAGVERVPGLGWVLRTLNARAVTIYLWHEVALVVAVWLVTRLALGGGDLVTFAIAWALLLAVAAPLFGLLEDLAAGRRPSPNPGAVDLGASRRVARRSSTGVAGAAPRLRGMAESGGRAWARWERESRAAAGRGRGGQARWLAFGSFVGVALLLLFANGLSTQTTGRSVTNDSAAAAPLAGSQPLLTEKDWWLESPQPPTGRRVALTFDDGPDPKWTPRIADALLELDVPATFFVLGSHVVKHPDIVRRLHERGFELGNHTFNHADLAAVPEWRRSLEVGLTDTAVAGAAGVRPLLMRPPYSATTDAVTNEQAESLVPIARNGHVIALSELDSRDWARPGVERIVENAVPRGRGGGVILLHDAGGDRSQTVSAVKRLVPALHQRGFRFVTLAELLGVPRHAVEVPASELQVLRGKLLIGALTAARWVTSLLTVLLVVVGALTVVRLLLALSLARRHVAAGRRRAPGRFTPAVSIVVPAHNEATDIGQSLRSLAGSDYPDFEVILVDDGSTDRTAEIVEDMRLPGVRVLRQQNGGKASALNRGLAAARHDVIVMVDADTVFERDTLRQLVIPLRDPSVGAVSGNTKVANRFGLLGRWQHIEYVVNFNLDRRLFEVLNCMPTVPGAVGAFRRQALSEIGGVSGATLAEDTDLTIALGRAGWRVVYAEEARAWTDAPASLGDLWRQRYRWAFGTLQSVWKHRAALWRPGEEKIGRRALPYLALFQIALPLFGPLVDVFALYGLLFLDPLMVGGFWLLFLLLQLVTAVYGFRLDRESMRPLWALPLQQFVYRQIMYLVVVESVVSALRGVRIGWQHVRRTGRFELAHAGAGLPAAGSGGAPSPVPGAPAQAPARATSHPQEGPHDNGRPTHRAV